jgi:hypothetical protein
MKVNERLYPHPVLSYYSDDVIDSSLVVSITPAEYVDKYKLDIEFTLDNPALQNLLLNQKVAFAIHIECAKTGYRALFKSFNNIYQEFIPEENLNGRVEVCSFIIANDNIFQYKNEKFHSDYNEASFQVKKGDVLAIAKDIYFDAEKNADPLRRISSIFRVRENPDIKSSYDINIEGEYIVIYLSKENFSAFSKLQIEATQRPLLISMLIVPALVYVIEYISSESAHAEELESKKWYRAIDKKMREHNYPLDEPDNWTSLTPSIAIELIGDQLSSALVNILAIDEEAE